MRCITYLTSLVIGALYLCFFQNIAYAAPVAPVTEGSNSQIKQTKILEGKETSNNFQALLSETPPTINDGVQATSRNGFWFLIPWRNGFTIQPQAEQYIKVGNAANLNIQSTGGLPVIPSTATVSMTRWTLQPDNTWLKSSPESFRSGTSLTGLHSTTITKSGLGIGTYYFQMAVTYSSITYYSQLAKVGVVDRGYPATNINIQPSSPVVFANADYNVTANLMPNNSTSLVNWTGDNVTYMPTTGRTVRFKTGEISGVNESTANPGLPLNLTGTANGLSDTKTVYVGGLKAKNITEDTARSNGISWTIDGLDPLVNQYGNEYTWNYKWVYYDSNGVSTDFTAGEAINGSGTLTNIGDLNSTKQLMIPSNSPFIAKAVTATKNNRPFSVKLVLTTNNNGNELKLPTNQARLTITPTTGRLILKQVPTFDFGQIAASQIYQGNLTNSNQPTASQPLEISDTRIVKDWQLQAKMGQMTSGTQSLSQVTLNLSGLANTSSKQLTDQNTNITLLTSNDTNPGLWTVNARLQVGANPTIKLLNQDIFMSTIIWSLTSATPTIPAA